MLTIGLFIIILGVLGFILTWLLNKYRDSQSNDSTCLTVNNNKCVSLLRNYYPFHSSSKQKRLSFWEMYKNTKPQEASELEVIFGMPFSSLNEDDIKERIKSVEKAANAQKCKISDLKGNYLKLFDKYIPEFGDKLLKESFYQIQQMDLACGIKKGNSLSTIALRWLEQYKENRDKTISPEQQFRETIRHSMRQELCRIVNSDGNSHLKGMEAYIIINSMCRELERSNSLKAMDKILAPKGLSAHSILEEERNHLFKEYLGMDMDSVKNDEVDDDSLSYIL